MKKLILIFVTTLICSVGFSQINITDRLEVDTWNKFDNSISKVTYWNDIYHSSLKGGTLTLMTKIGKITLLDTGETKWFLSIAANMEDLWVDEGAPLSITFEDSSIYTFTAFTGGSLLYDMVAYEIPKSKFYQLKTTPITSITIRLRDYPITIPLIGDKKYLFIKFLKLF
ncbi:MAG: hypothetical protein FWF42_03430 [Streptococcaceae bacterium]|nr:hypothetical protein [Streptococcaceae bacterium]